MQILKNENNLFFYDICDNGYVDVILIGEIPYSGYWQFTITPEDYQLGTEGDAARLLEAMINAENNEDWSLRGCSCTCTWEELYDELKDVLTKETKEALDEYVASRK